MILVLTGCTALPRPELVSLAIEGGDTFQAGEAVQLKAVGTHSVGSTRDLITEATLSSSDMEVAAFDASLRVMKVTDLLLGGANITATTEDQVATKTLLIKRLSQDKFLSAVIMTCVVSSSHY